MKRMKYTTVLATLMVVLLGLSSIGCRKQHVVLVCGDVAESGFTEFWCDTARMYETFVSRGIEPQTIHVLYGDGVDWTCPHNPAHNFPAPITDFAATTGNLSVVFNGLAHGDAAHGIEQAGPSDTLIVWTFDHGSPGNLCLRDGDMTTATFQNLVNQINCAKKVFFMQQCFSGDFVAPLTAGNTNTAILTAAVALENRAIRYYSDAAEKIRALPEVSRALKTLAKKHTKRLAQVENIAG